MKKISVLVSCFLFVVVMAVAQPKSKVSNKTSPGNLEKLLKGSGLPVTMINDSLAVIPYGGEHIESYNVAIQQAGDLYLVFTNLSDAVPGKINESNYKYLLQQNEHFDIIKISMSADDQMFVRADVYKTNLNTATLSRIVKQVANVTNIIAGQLK